MRLLLFFDLPVEKLNQQRAYRIFVKEIKKLGFYMMQKSVYVKLCIDNQNANSITSKVEELCPNEGNIFILSVTEKQFSEIKILLGENISDIINNDDRVVEL